MSLAIYPTALDRGRYAPQERLGERFNDEPSRLQLQASFLLTDKESRQAFPQVMATTKDGLPAVQITADDAVAARMEVTEAMVDGMNADVDQVSTMLNANPNADLFQALKDRDRDAAIDFAVHNQEFQTQALHGMNDEAFQQEVRLRLSGTI